MGYDKRDRAKEYTPADGDTLQSIAKQESTSDHTLTWQEIARFNWGTDSPETVDEFLRDELGCYKRGEDKHFIFSADVDVRTPLLIPQCFVKSGLATTKTHKIKVHKKAKPPNQFEACTRVEGITFEFDSDKIRSSETADVEKVAYKMNEHPDAKAMIFGHTDKVGSETYNKDLSERRAKSVYTHLTTKSGIEAGRFMDPKHTGCGEFNPVKDTEAAHEPNRRVTVFLFNPDRLPNLPCQAGAMTSCKKQCKQPLPRHKDSFHCSFYDSIAKKCPAEGGVVGPKLLELVSVDDHFAPGHEKADIAYKIQGYAGEKVVLEISSDHYSNNPIFEKELEASEKSDGDHTFQFDGKATCTEGSLKDGKFIHPLLAPYKVVLKASGQKSNELTFKVLYGDIQLEKGPWVSDGSTPPESEERKWLRYQLNELGYFGGPFTNDASETALQKGYLDRAIKVYKKSNGEFLKKCIDDSKIQKAIDANPEGKSIYDYLDEKPDQFDGLLAKEIKKKSNEWPDYFKADADFFKKKDKTARFQVPSLYYEKGDQFQAGGEIRYNEDARRLNDPFVPILAKVRLLSKADKNVDSPDAVGPAKIAWRVEDIDEPGMAARYQIDVRHDPSKPSDDKCRLKYMQDVQTWVAANAKFSDGTAFKKNCPGSIGGKDDLAKIFLSYEPFKVDKPAKLPRSEAYTDKTTKWKALVGKSGVNFSPSKIGGDSYRVIADLDFTGFPNANDLKTWHGADGNGRDARKTETGVVTIWREDPFIRIVQWPGVSHADYKLDRVHLDYDQTYIDMSVPGAGDLLDITNVIEDDDYQKLIREFEPKNLKAQLTAEIGADDADRMIDDATPGRVKLLFIPLWQKFSLTKDCLYGRDVPDQEDLSGADYESALNLLFYDDNNGFVNKVSRPMARLVSNKLRPQYPRGHLVVAFRPHRPVDILKDGSDASKGYRRRDFVASFVSYGLADGVVTYDLGDTDRRGYVIAHEFGHHNFLYHHEAASDKWPKHHDTNDHNCIMSYTDGVAPRISEKYNPLFCGKCNLRLRGWKVTGASIPAHS